MSGAARLSIYTATMVAGTVFFFLLHHVGNQLPYELAKQRFAVEFEANPQFTGVPDGRRERFGSCQISLAIIAGAHRDAAYRPLVDAVLIKNFRREIAPRSNFCPELRAASIGVELTKRIEKTYHWWGHKALSAIALRYLTVPDLYRLILVAGFGAWLLLAAAVAPMGWRALLVAGPTIVFGVAFSDVAGFAELAHGISYAWAVLAAALLALLLLRPATARAAPWFCFVTGMTSSYLWFFDGHTTLALALIGLVAWLGYERLAPRGGARRAAGCVALYAAGFVLCFALGQVTKAVVHDLHFSPVEHSSAAPEVNPIARKLFKRAYRLLDRMAAEVTDKKAAMRWCKNCPEGSWAMLPTFVREFTLFFQLVPLDRSVVMVLTCFSVLALAGAAAVAVRQARRGRWKLAMSVLWLVALALLVLAQFLLPNDVPFRESRFVFLVLATGWTCLVLAMMQLDRRGASILAGCMAGGMLSIAAAAGPVAGWWLDRTLATTRHIVRSDFDVYLDKAGRRLFYVKEECSGTDVEARFFLHVVPVDPAILSKPRRRHGFVNYDFGFQDLGYGYGGYGTRVGRRCVSMRPLPVFEIAEIRTGQFIPGSSPIWGAAVGLAERIDAVPSER